MAKKFPGRGHAWRIAAIPSPTRDGHECPEDPVDLAEDVDAPGIGQAEAEPDEAAAHAGQHRRDGRPGRVLPTLLAHPVGAAAVEGQPAPPDTRAFQRVKTPLSYPVGYEENNTRGLV